jgi:DNA-binding XRE family transcriptional regulator
MNVREYFLGFNVDAIKETKKILQNPESPNFIPRIFTILSRCDNTKEVFSIIDKTQFAEIWSMIKRYWIKKGTATDFRAWWETIYEQLTKKNTPIKSSQGTTVQVFQYLGKTIKNARIDKGWSQVDLAKKTGVVQNLISRIEHGTTSYSIKTLVRICTVLDIDNIKIPILIQ